MSPQIHSKILIRRFLRVFLPLSALVGSIVGTIYFQQMQSEKVVLKTNELSKVDLQTKVISADFDSVVSDLIVLSKQNELQGILEGVDGEQQALSREFLLFSQYKKLYDQIRFLDQSGKEVVKKLSESTSTRVNQELSPKKNCNCKPSATGLMTPCD